MAMRDGTPIGNGAGAPGYIGPLHPFDWIDYGANEAMGIMPASAARGQPVPFANWQRRQIAGPGTIAQGFPIWLHSRPYSRGAQAYSPKFGTINYNPIGAGIYAPYRLPTIAGPGARYQYGAIWFGVQTIPTSIRMNPTMPVETINALIATSQVSAMYPTTG
jgi:hypothetical protein